MEIGSLEYLRKIIEERDRVKAIQDAIMSAPMTCRGFVF